MLQLDTKPHCTTNHCCPLLMSAVLLKPHYCNYVCEDDALTLMMTPVKSCWIESELWENQATKQLQSSTVVLTYLTAHIIQAIQCRSATEFTGPLINEYTTKYTHTVILTTKKYLKDCIQGNVEVTVSKTKIKVHQKNLPPPCKQNTNKKGKIRKHNYWTCKMQTHDVNSNNPQL